MKVTFKPGIFHAKRALGLIVFTSFLFTVSIFLNHGNFVQPQGKIHIHRNRMSGKVWSNSQKNRMDYSHMGRRQRNYCNAHGHKKISRDMFSNTYVNDKYKIVYCSVPKVACTNWARMFLILSGHMNTTNPMAIRSPDVHGKYSKYLKSLSEFSEDEIKYRLDNYYKFVFTREPFERVLSAYMNKFKGKNPYFHSRYGKMIVDRYRVHNKKANMAGDDVTFREFVQYLTDFTRKGTFNDHWETMTELCHPCVIKYDFIGTMDNMNSDSDHILKKIGASKIVKFPSRSATYKHANTKTFLRQYYSQIPAAMLDQLLDVYYPDFVMFNLTIPKSLKEIIRWKEKY